MHLEAAKALNINYRYEIIDAMNHDLKLDEIIYRAETNGFKGLNITYPFKREALAFADELSEDSRKIGAINTLVFSEGKRYGYNTDYIGFSKAYRKISLGRKSNNILLIGTGGAGAAISNAIVVAGADRLALYDVDPDSAETLRKRTNGHFATDRVVVAKDISREIEFADGIVNASTAGMDTHPGIPIDPVLLEKRHWVFDIIYFPIETMLLKSARRKGCFTVNGADMAVYQAIYAFELFTGIKPDYESMRNAFNSFDIGGKALQKENMIDN